MNFGADLWYIKDSLGSHTKKKYAPVPKKAPLKMMRRVYELGPQNTKMATTLGLDTLWSRYLVLHELIGITHKKKYAPVPKKAPLKIMRRVYELGPQNTTIGTTLVLDTL